MAGNPDTSSENKHFIRAARKVLSVVNGINIPESAKNVILRAIEWIVNTSRTHLDRTLTEFLSCQLCRVMELVESYVCPGAVRLDDCPQNYTSDVKNSDEPNLLHRSLTVQADATGIPPGASFKNRSPNRHTRPHPVIDDRPDVLIDIPDLTTEHLALDLSDFRLNLALDTTIASNLVVLRPTVECTVGKCEVSIDRLRASALAVVRMDNIRQIAESTLDSAAHNPAILERANSATQRVPVSEVGRTKEAQKGEDQGDGDYVPVRVGSEAAGPDSAQIPFT